MTWIIHTKKGSARDLTPEREAIRAAKKTLRRMQIDLPPRPVKSFTTTIKGKAVQVVKPLNPVLPPDLTALSNRRLGRLYGEFCAMAQYAQLRLAIHAVENAVAKQVEKYVRAQARLRVRGRSGTITAEVEVHPVVRKRTAETLVADGVETITTAILQSYLICRDACSREMTRRQWANNPDRDR